jgi:hypothetical protein
MSSRLREDLEADGSPEIGGTVSVLMWGDYHIIQVGRRGTP